MAAKAPKRAPTSAMMDRTEGTTAATVDKMAREEEATEEVVEA